MELPAAASTKIWRESSREMGSGEMGLGHGCIDAEISHLPIEANPEGALGFMTNKMAAGIV
ncbi:hypothetical protein [Granulicella sp. dw_53]|uniref:hypothetical protein n=1 Tax=Granulicella sp. dw_53 TaxID=2719792 RepID=UPI001BD6D07D|nr:hypothetical protein [Granulicella sp. dw_53]